jgi:DnaA family protein
VTTSRAQLALRFPALRPCTFETFECGGNGELVERLRDAATERFTLVWVFGANGAGKSHLLQAACAATTRAGRLAAYLSAATRRAGADVLDGLDAYDRVAIDDFEGWLGDAGIESALLALYQSLAARQRSLVIATEAGPASTAFALPDLASRLRAAEVHRLLPLDDDARERLIDRLARSRGLSAGPEVMRYLMRWGPRGSGDLCALMDRIDAASLAAQRALTVPLVREVLQRGEP